MKYRLSSLTCALGAVIGLSSGQVNAALPTNPVLDFDSGVSSCVIGGTYPSCTYGLSTVKSGSYFAMDLTNIGTFDPTERVAITTAGNGLIPGQAQGIGEIDVPWSFGGSNGNHYTKNPLALTSTGVNTYEVNMSGWTVNWGAEGDIDMGAGSPAVLTCGVDCSIGDAFTLEYTATVPNGSFAGVNYLLYLEGTVTTVPVPAAVWLFGSGLLGLFSLSRRKQK